MLRTLPDGPQPEQQPKMGQQRPQPPRRSRGAVATLAALFCAAATVVGATAGTPRAALAQTASSDPGTRLNQQADPEEAAEEAAETQREEAKRRNDTIFGIVAFMLMVAAATGVAIYARRLDKPVPVPEEPFYPEAVAARPVVIAAPPAPEVPAGSTAVLTEHRVPADGAGAPIPAPVSTARVFDTPPPAAPPAPAAAAEPIVEPVPPVNPPAPAFEPAAPVVAEPRRALPAEMLNGAATPAAPFPPAAQPLPVPSPPPVFEPFVASPPAASVAAATAAVPVVEDRPTVIKPRGADGAPLVPPAILEIVSGPVAGRRQPLAPFREAVLGRANDADIVIPDAEVSRRHARLARGEDGTYTMVDMASANGLHVNGERVFQATLRDGDRVRLGQTEMVFRMGAE